MQGISALEGAFMALGQCVECKRDTDKTELVVHKGDLSSMCIDCYDRLDKWR